MSQEKQEKNSGQDPEYEEKNENPKKGRLVWILLLAIVLAVFGAIVLFTDFLGNQFGETAENIVLTVIAVILAILLYLTHKQK